MAVSEGAPAAKLVRERAAAAVAYAVVALALAGFDTLEVFQKLDWDTVFFTAAFTVFIGALERVEALKGLTLWLQEAAGGSLALVTLLVLLVSGAASLLLPNLIARAIVRWLPWPKWRILSKNASSRLRRSTGRSWTS